MQVINKFKSPSLFLPTQRQQNQLSKREKGWDNPISLNKLPNKLFKIYPKNPKSLTRYNQIGPEKTIKYKYETHYAAFILDRIPSENKIWNYMKALNWNMLHKGRGQVKATQNTFTQGQN